MTQRHSWMSRFARLVPIALALAPILARADEEAEAAWQAWRAARIDEAGELARSILAEHPRNDSARHLSLVVAFVRGDYEDALAEYLLISPDYSDHDALDEIVLDAYLHLGRLREAAAFARRAGRPEAECAVLEQWAERPTRLELEETTILPFTQDDAFAGLMPAVAIELNGRPMLGHLDTGGTYIVTSPEKIRELGIEVRETGSGIANDQATTVSEGLVETLRLGGATLYNVPVTSVAALSGQFEDLVILGTQVLSRFLTTWDNQAGRLILSPRHDPEARRRHLETYAAAAREMPFYLAGDHRMWASGAIGERSVLFFVDTGLMAFDERGRQVGLAVPAETLASWGVDVAGRQSVDSPGSVSLGSARSEQASIFVFQDRRNLPAVAGLAPDALLAQGFLKAFNWTLDFDRRKYLLAPIVRGTAEPAAPERDAASLEAYVGSYQVAAGIALQISAVNGTLFVQAPGQQKVPMTAGVAADSFEIKIAGARIEFTRDAAGIVNELVLRQGGTEQRARREP